MTSSKQFMGGMYADKGDEYFAGERRDIVDRLAQDPNRTILEIGCGSGATGAYARRTGKCGRYVGIEAVASAASEASKRLDEVHLADVELFEPPFGESTFDVVIAGEILEHLKDPWLVVRKYRSYLRINGIFYASSPNVAHRSTLLMLLKGGWDLEREGLMDRTHLRWFTPRTYAKLFEEAGYKVIALEPLAKASAKVSIINALTANRLSHLFIRQMLVVAQVPDDGFRSPISSLRE
jgi:2-polyprenyl-3-methyl-5-hydroxy-6-metoxy-1,4-benzoquinol methylase